MNIEDLRIYCLQKPGTTESTPFGDDVLVFKVMEKMFATVNLNEGNTVNLKCHPDTAIDLRERYEAVTAGYHMNKKHWNTLHLFKDLNSSQIKHWVNHSYELVVAGLPKKQCELLKTLSHDK